MRKKSTTTFGGERFPCPHCGKFIEATPIIQMNKAGGFPSNAPTQVEGAIPNLSVRARNCLRSAGIDTLDQLCSIPVERLLKIRNFGRGTLDEIREKVKDGAGLRLGATTTRKKIRKKNMNIA